MLSALAVSAAASVVPGASIVDLSLRFGQACRVGDVLAKTVQVEVMHRLIEVSIQATKDTLQPPVVVLNGRATLLVKASHVRSLLG